MGFESLTTHLVRWISGRKTSKKYLNRPKLWGMNNPRFVRLQIYRGWAIVCVVGFHAFARWTPPLNLENLYPWNIFDNKSSPFTFGYLGVNLFFMISGFVITQSLENSRNLVEFWRRRMFRIWPSLTVIILATYILGHIYRLKPNNGMDNLSIYYSLKNCSGFSSISSFLDWILSDVGLL